MDFQRYIVGVAALMSMLVLLACNSDIDNPEYGQDCASLILRVGSESPGSRSSGEGKSPATDLERSIRRLYYFAFPMDSEARLVKGALSPIPDGSQTANERYMEYKIDDVTPGKYKIYVVANMDGMEDVTTEAELRKVILHYNDDDLPEAGNLPMSSMPDGITEVKAGGTTVEVHLRFTCVKVRYNLIFDKGADAEAAASFGKSGLMITSVGAVRLSAHAPLIDTAPMSGDERKESFDAEFASGEYFASFVETDGSGGSDVIQSLSGKPVTYADKWVYTGTVYLPERFVTDSDSQSCLTVEARIVDDDLPFGALPGMLSPVTKYEIPLGHADATGDPLQLPRATYYEITGRIIYTHVTKVAAEVKVRDWMPAGINDMGPTVLIVDNTKIQLTSSDIYKIHYETNADSVTMGCDVSVDVDGEPLDMIVRYDLDPETGCLKFQINPDIHFDVYDADGPFPPAGKVKIWIQANNLRKYLDVSYEVTPLFEVTPTEETISWIAEDPASPMHRREFRYRTNLGGIRGVDFPYVSEIGMSRLRVDCENPDAGTGVITVNVLCDPVTSTTHSFRFVPAIEERGMYADIDIHVRSEKEAYRIYFRAINDRSDTDPGIKTVQWSGILAESLHSGDNNWDDGWGRHLIYAYTQLGETDGQAIPEYYVWRFLDEWEKNPPMTRDETNRGWYYFDLDINAIGYNKDDGSYKRVKPGETNIMFHHDQRHMCPTSYAPGFQLFDYYDREGWALFDPLRDPVYRVYDDRPDVVDVKYVVYSTERVKRWYCNYGIQNVYTIWDTPESVKDGSMYRTEMIFKAEESDYSKAVMIEYENGLASPIFNRQNYYDKSNPGEVTGYSLYHLDEYYWLPVFEEIDEPLASGYRRLYFRANYDWFKDKEMWIHTWARTYDEAGNKVSDGAGTSWPGVKMTHVKGDWWRYDLPPGQNCFLFHLVNGAQTKDIELRNLGEGSRYYLTYGWRQDYDNPGSWNYFLDVLSRR